MGLEGDKEGGTKIQAKEEELGDIEKLAQSVKVMAILDAGRDSVMKDKDKFERMKSVGAKEISHLTKLAKDNKFSPLEMLYFVYTIHKSMMESAMKIIDDEKRKEVGRHET